MIKMSPTIGLLGPFPVLPPFSPHDHSGYEVSLTMLLFSRRGTGAHNSSYTHYDSKIYLVTVLSTSSFVCYVLLEQLFEQELYHPS